MITTTSTRSRARRQRGSRKGFTTGACVAAAARAAAEGLVHGVVPGEVRCVLANGTTARFPVSGGRCDERSAHAEVVKDAGDDPDVTNGAVLQVDLLRLPGETGTLRFSAGEGVGLVTMPGLGLEVGGPAINPVPRQNIRDNIVAVAAELLASDGLQVTVSVPGGERLAARTLNRRLGIMGGISILGTSGIVHPWSTAAFRASVIQAVEVAGRQGQSTVVLTTGGRTETFVKAELAHLPPSCFVQMGDFISAAFDTIVAHEIPHVVIGGMVGKLAKMAQGEPMTHARRNPVDTRLLAEVARAVGAPATLCTAIAQATTARFALERMTEHGLATAFLEALAERVVSTLRGRYPDRFTLRVLVCDFDGKKLTEVQHA